jgi:hypothetical protein
MVYKLVISDISAINGASSVPFFLIGLLVHTHIRAWPHTRSKSPNPGLHLGERRLRGWACERLRPSAWCVVIMLEHAGTSVRRPGVVSVLYIRHRLRMGRRWPGFDDGGQ